MKEAPFTNRELESMFDRVHEKLDEVGDKVDGLATKVDYTNGKVRRLTLSLIVVGSVCGTLLLTNGSELLGFILKVI